MYSIAHKNLGKETPRWEVILQKMVPCTAFSNRARYGVLIGPIMRKIGFCQFLHLILSYFCFWSTDHFCKSLLLVGPGTEVEGPLLELTFAGGTWDEG
jgi:hypothetical protein